jgi:hypothetical protein
MIRNRILVGLLLCAAPLVAQGDKQFSIPVASLKEWSSNIVVTMNAKILGNSGVHAQDADCEMHFGASVEGYKGDPDGFVIEPMNICIENFFGSPKYVKSQWVTFAKSLANKSVRAAGVPRIWPEHLDTGDNAAASNPHHAVEIHPLTTMQVGSKPYDFTKFIYAPEGYEGGVSASTAESLLTDLEVGVTTDSTLAKIDFDAGRIGNFTTFEVRLRKQTSDGSDAIEQLPGGHRIAGEVVLTRSKAIPVSLLTVAGTAIDDRVVKFKAGARKTITLDTLVLFSLSPAALMDAAANSRGSRVVVRKPIQLILYGETDQ